MTARLFALWRVLPLSAMMACVMNGGEVQPGPQANGMDWAAARAQMVDEQIRARGVADERVLAAMRKVPRHLFVPPEHQRRAYDDTPLPIGFDQTISQPYIVAYMSEVLELEPEHRVLEIGTGSGYQAAVLAVLAREVYSIEIIRELGESAAAALKRLGYANVVTRIGDGYQGWPEHAPFDGIMVTAAPDHIPPALIEQLKPGGRLVIPVGDLVQDLMVVEKKPDGTTTSTAVVPVRFVPLTREQ